MLSLIVPHAVALVPCRAEMGAHASARDLRLVFHAFTDVIKCLWFFPPALRAFPTARLRDSLGHTAVDLFYDSGALTCPRQPPTSKSRHLVAS